MKKIIILGSTGSIGTQTLDIVDENPDLFTVTALSCRSRVDELIQQIEKYRPLGSAWETKRMLVGCRNDSRILPYTMATRVWFS